MDLGCDEDDVDGRGPYKRRSSKYNDNYPSSPQAPRFGLDPSTGRYQVNVDTNGYSTFDHTQTQARDEGTGYISPPLGMSGLHGTYSDQGYDQHARQSQHPRQGFTSKGGRLQGQGTERQVYGTYEGYQARVQRDIPRDYLPFHQQPQSQVQQHHAQQTYPLQPVPGTPQSSLFRFSNQSQQYPLPAKLTGGRTDGDAPGLPGPRTAALHGAFEQALKGPRWVNGQRTFVTDLHTHPAPDTHSGNLFEISNQVSLRSFPISLGGEPDPFSRAVSPIRGDLDVTLEGLQVGLGCFGAASGRKMNGDGRSSAGAHGVDLGESNRGHTAGLDSSDPFTPGLDPGMGEIAGQADHSGQGDIEMRCEVGGFDSSSDFDMNLDLDHHQVPGQNHIHSDQERGQDEAQIQDYTPIQASRGIEWQDPFAISPLDPISAIPHTQAFSAPTSPSFGHTALPLDHSLHSFPSGNPDQVQSGLFRSTSAAPMLTHSHTHPHAVSHPYASKAHAQPHPLSILTQSSSSAQTQAASIHSANPDNQYNIHSPAVIALQKIRKPSLRTLLSRGGSLAGSAQVSPISSPISSPVASPLPFSPAMLALQHSREGMGGMTVQSPTLFDEAMSLDEPF